MAHWGTLLVSYNRWRQYEIDFFIGTGDDGSWRGADGTVAVLTSLLDHDGGDVPAEGGSGALF